MMHSRQFALENVLLLLGRLQGEGRGIVVVYANTQTAQGTLQILLVALQTLQYARLLLQQLIQLIQLTYLGLKWEYIYTAYVIE